MGWTRIKDAAIAAGLEPWLRPMVDKLRRRQPSGDDVAALALIARLPRNAVCVDIGCHKGRLLDPMRRAAPQGRFFAFEPVPYLFKLLQAKYRGDDRVQIFNLALSSRHGSAEFFVNEGRMALSGLHRRPGRMHTDELTSVEIPLRTLDETLGDQPVDFIKIDVEGAEHDVLLGAQRTIARSRPLILFEFGLGGADYFGVDDQMMFELFASMDYALYTLEDCIDDGGPLAFSDFHRHFAQNSKYNFVARSRRAAA
jgi:FkbM family methyltransferase